MAGTNVADVISLNGPVGDQQTTLCASEFDFAITADENHTGEPKN
jgi:hypothetical protein